MRMRKQDYEILRQSILDAAGGRLALVQWIADKRARGLSEMRIRWDMLHGARLTSWICSDLYSYLSDQHIDTALRAVVADISPALEKGN